MSCIKLEKLINDCVANIKVRLNEDEVIKYVHNVASDKTQYNDLITRIVYDVCAPVFSVWKYLPYNEWVSTTDRAIKSLYVKSFKIAFPEAYKVIQSYY